MRLLTIICLASLYSCSGLKFTDQQNKQFNRLATRCDIEAQDILKIEKPLAQQYCNCQLKSLASREYLEEHGAQKALDRLYIEYKIEADVSRAVASEDQTIIDRYPKDRILTTSRRMDSCLDTAKAFFYEKEINQKINSEIGE